MTTATHQQNGQRWGNANGNHGAQKPMDVETAIAMTPIYPVSSKVTH